MPRAFEFRRTLARQLLAVQPGLRIIGPGSMGIASPRDDIARFAAPNLPLAEVRTLEEVVERSMAHTSFTMLLLAVAALVAVEDRRFFKHHGVWSPGVRLLRNLTFQRKAAIVTVALFVPITLLAWGYEQEMQGVDADMIINDGKPSK